MTDTPTTIPQALGDEHAPCQTALTLDAQEYCHFLADCDWTDEQKLEFTKTLWLIIVNFVDMGFELHPVQQVKVRESEMETDLKRMLGFKRNSKNNKKQNAVCETQPRG